MQGYIMAMGFFFWPLFFSGIIIYVYLKYQSFTMVAVIILILIAVFSDALAGVPAFYNFLYIATALIFTALILMFISRRRNQ